jgi:cold shock CspA family protein
MKIEGFVIWYDPKRSFGFVETRTPVPGGGFELKKFYFNRTYIQFTTVEQIENGNAVRFDIKDVPQRTSNDAPRAVNVEVFKDLEQLRTYTMLTEAK